VDRPGHGLSEPYQNRSLLDWADDVRQLADHLGIDKFYVMGLSAGGPHALACAYKLKERISACAVVSGLAPPDRPNPYGGLPIAHRIIMFVFRNSPRLTHMMRRGMYSLSQGDMDTLRGKLMSGFPQADRKLLEIPENTAMMIEEIREGYRQGWSGPACDDIVINKLWGFRLSDVQVRVDLWHGKLDGNIPLAHANYQAAHIWYSRLTVWPELAHLGLLLKWREVLSSLVDSAPRK
jgi:pimeloyl-ACP methyl ester carboxylesterase